MLKKAIVPLFFIVVFALPVTLTVVESMYEPLPLPRATSGTRIEAYISKVQPTAPAARITNAIVSSAKACNIDPYLVTSLMHTESNFKVDAESETGARGLMQIVKSTFESLGGEWDMAYDIETNISKGSCYLARHVKTYEGRVDLALKRYNGNDDPRFSQKVLSKLRNLSDVHGITIVVQKGDTLAGIAQTYLGDAEMYHVLAEYNDISNPNVIAVGQHIVIGGEA